MKRVIQGIAILGVFALGGLSALLVSTLGNGAEGRGSPSALPASPVSPAAAAVPANAGSQAAAPARPTRPLARTDDEQNTIDVFRLAAPSAVFVTQRQVVVDWVGGRALDVPAGSGSGFVWDTAGHVVTNFHVIQKAKRLTVTLHDHRTLDASVVGAEPRKDIAVLKIDAAPGSLVPITHPTKPPALEVGQKVIAIGNPFGLDQTLTTGIVSALGREVDGIGGVTIRQMIQTDAAINPGNSGGPLLDSLGELVGMNTMIYSRSGAWAGIGFAVPASVIQRIVPQIIRTGRATQVGLGIAIDPQQRIERRLRIRGVVVLSVPEGSPAAAAGLQGVRRSVRGFELGDVIIGIDDHPIQDYDDLYNTLDQYRANTEVSVKVLRGKKEVASNVKLIELE